MREQTTIQKALGGLETARFYLLNLKATELPGADIETCEARKMLPSISAVYFVIDDAGRIVCIGKAYNLKDRWKAHHCAPRLSELTGARLAWCELPFGYLTAVESLLIQVHRPAWNQTERCTERDLHTRTAPERFKGLFS